MDIYDTAAVHNDIEQQFYKAKINKIMRLAKSGQYTDAFRVIMKINLGVNSELHQRELWDGVNELMVLDGGPPEDNPFNQHQKSAKRIAAKNKKMLCGTHLKRRNSVRKKR